MCWSLKVLILILGTWQQDKMMATVGKAKDIRYSKIANIVSHPYFKLGQCENVSAGV